MEFKWSELKNKRLKKARGVSFEEVTKSELVTSHQHPKKKNQRILLFRFQGYIWAAPCVKDENFYFLKTLYPCRKYHKRYKKEKRDEEKD